MTSVAPVPGTQRRVHTNRVRVGAVCCLLVMLSLGGLGMYGAMGGMEEPSSTDTTAKGKNSIPVKKGELKEPLYQGKSVTQLVERANRLKQLMLNREISRETIFVNTASFRDVFCRQTVRNMYDVALHPERIYMGIIDQRLPGDEMCIPPEYLRHAPLPHIPLREFVTTTIPPGHDPEHPPIVRRFQSCWKHAGFCPLDNLRHRIVKDSEARGPTYGRFVAGLLYQGESFYMMIDSHSIFVPHFDELFILDVLRMKESYITPEVGGKGGGGGVVGIGGVLSNYPGSFNRYDKTPNLADNMVSMCRIQYIDSLKILRNGPSHVIQAPRAKPLRHAHTAGGFLFSEATVQLVVPYDPYLDFVFDGEEVLYSTRLFTLGFDAYMPSMPNIFHHYERHKAPRFWSVKDTKWGKIVETTRLRVHYFMQTYVNQTTTLIVDHAKASKKGVSLSEGTYAPGDVRSVQAFYDYAGIGRTSWKVSEQFCIKMGSEAMALKKATPDWRW